MSFGPRNATGPPIGACQISLKPISLGTVSRLLLSSIWLFFNNSMMINPKACFSEHSQWPPKSFRLSRV
ncbi:hypothetical protein ACSQ67_005170 [Phaseolus vulgaris]